MPQQVDKWLVLADLLACHRPSAIRLPTGRIGDVPPLKREDVKRDGGIPITLHVFRFYSQFRSSTEALFVGRAAAFALAGVLAFAAVVAGVATALALAVVVAFAVVLGHLAG